MKESPRVNVIHCCLQECVKAHKCTIIGQIEHEMCLEKFIKCPKGAVCLAWDEMLIQGDVEAVNLASLTSNGKEVRVLMLVFTEVLLQTAA